MAKTKQHGMRLRPTDIAAIKLVMNKYGLNTQIEAVQLALFALAVMDKQDWLTPEKNEDSTNVDQDKSDNDNEV